MIFSPQIEHVYLLKLSMGKFISSVWEFDANEQYLPVHKVFRWYGKLPPPLVQKVLDLYVNSDDKVLANFSGSGTIAVEAMLRGIDCTGIDINPLALLISRVKTTKFSVPSFEQKVNLIVQQARKNYRSTHVDDTSLYEPDKWYPNDTAKKILALKKQIKKEKNALLVDLLMVALLGSLRDVSRIDSRCVNHIVVDYHKEAKDIFEEFKVNAIEVYEMVQSLPRQGKTPRFELASAAQLSMLKDESIDFVFSHPPYLNAVNYYNINRLCTDVLGKEYNQIREKDFSSKKYEVFLDLMEKSFIEAHRVLKQGKRMAVVIGDTRFLGNLLTLHVDFVNLLKKNGFDIEDIFVWVLNQKAGMNVARRGNFIDHNYVIIGKKK